MSSFQVFVRTVSGNTVLLNVDSTDTIEVVKEQFRQREGTPLHWQRLMWAGKQLDDDKTLCQYGIQPCSVLSQVLRLRGGSNPLPLSFATMEEGKFKAFSDNAPHYKTVTHGFSLKGKCGNAECKAHGRQVWCKIGYKYSNEDFDGDSPSVGFDIPSLVHTAPCPVCQQFVASTTIVGCGFYKCQYFFEGIKVGAPRPIRGRGEVLGGSGYEFYDWKSGTSFWQTLTIAVKPPEEKKSSNRKNAQK